MEYISRFVTNKLKKPGMCPSINIKENSEKSELLFITGKLELGFLSITGINKLRIHLVDTMHPAVIANLLGLL